MTNAAEEFRWYYSEDHAVWHRAISRDDAVKKGRAAFRGVFLICEAKKEKLRDDFFDADQVIGSFEERNLDLWGDETEADPAAAAKAELEAALGAVFLAWRTKYTDWQAAALGETRNEEVVHPDG